MIVWHSKDFIILIMILSIKDKFSKTFYQIKSYNHSSVSYNTKKDRKIMLLILLENDNWNVLRTLSCVLILLRMDELLDYVDSKFASMSILTQNVLYKIIYFMTIATFG